MVNGEIIQIPYTVALPVFETQLRTPLSGIILYDAEGEILDLDDDQKKEWFRERGANVDDLSAEEVKQLDENYRHPRYNENFVPTAPEE
jgi:hypothetical protein